MSYDVELFVPMPGPGSLREKWDRWDEAQAAGNQPPPSEDDFRRVQAVLADVRSFDPSAQVRDLHDDDGRVTGFVVDDSEQLPYLEFSHDGGTLAFSLSSEPAGLYRVLMSLTSMLARHGVSAFDRQQGEVLQPSDDFATFMQQFSDQWSSPEAFRDWLGAQSGGRTAPAVARDAQKPNAGNSNIAAILFLLGVLVWGAYKLHKAGYF
jgi:hypothetical protein